MSSDSSIRTQLASSPTRFGSGYLWGFVGVVAFSFTVPLTRLAVGAMSPLFIASGRAVVAGVLAAIALLATRQVRPTGAQAWRLLIVAGGVVIGFPFLTSIALVTSPASHGAVVIALLPAATAVMAVLVGHERPPLVFWVLAALGACAAVAFAVVQWGGLGAPQWTDLLFFGAVISAAIGYAHGGVLARSLGSWQTVSWALIFALPLMVILAAVSMRSGIPDASASQWLSFAYLGVISMFLGFFAWYRGLAIGPMARVSQTQLVQPVLSILWAAMILGEAITWTTVIGGASVIACAAGAIRVRARR